MGLEILAAVLLAGLVLWLILDPFARPAASAQPGFIEPDDPEETEKGIALIALKEIDFDLATGKLSEEDHATLKRKYSHEAIAAIRKEEKEALPSTDEVIERLVADRVAVLREGSSSEALICPLCGPRPELDALFCSTCGLTLFGTEAACTNCRTPLEPKSQYCGACGTAVAV